MEQRTAEAKTEQAKQDIKTQVLSVVDRVSSLSLNPPFAEPMPAEYVSGCKNIGMPIEPLDVTSGTPPPVSGGFTFSTAASFGFTVSELIFADISDVV